MKIWAVINTTHFEVVKVFGSEESAVYYATHKNEKDDEDYFIYEEFEVDERLDDLYDFTEEDAFCMESATPPMTLGGDAYVKSDTIIGSIRRKILYVMASRIKTVYCIAKVFNNYISVDFYRSENIATEEFAKLLSRYPDANKSWINEDKDNTVDAIQFHGYFVEE